MNLMPISVLAIYSVVVSTGYPNQVDTIEEDNVEDRGWCKHCARGCEGLARVGELCSTSYRVTPSVCCPTGAGCKWEIGKVFNAAYCREFTKKDIEAKEKATKCECLDFMNGAYGNCKKEYQFWGRSICYISDTACCQDKAWSASAGKYYSWDACNSRLSKTCDWMLG